MRLTLPIPVLLTIAVVTAHATAAAQDLATVFVHGVRSDGNTWHIHAESLKKYLRIAPVAKSTTWLQREAYQANELIDELNNEAQTASSDLRIPFVAHSNGGLVSRQLSTTDPRLHNLITIATPHAGA